VLAEDREAVRLLALAFVPTWLLVAVAAAAVVAAGDRRRDLLLGPGAIVLAHVVACVLVFPLSRYRSPAIPALSVMAGVAVASALRSGRRVRIGMAAVAVGVAVLGAVPPQEGSAADVSRAVDRMETAMNAGREADADALARGILERQPGNVAALSVRIRVANAAGRYADARDAAARIVSVRPWDPDARLDEALAVARLGERIEARRLADEALAHFPWSAKVRGLRGAIRGMTGDRAGAREDVEAARAQGYRPPQWLLDEAGF
jgi:tetratricopeptide (TPR) repeat protein